MRISPAHARILEERCEARLQRLGADRIALLGAGQFTRALLESRAEPTGFADAAITSIIDESGAATGGIAGIPIVRNAADAQADAIVVATPMHEPAVLERAADGVFGSTPVLGLHTIEDDSELHADVLLLPQTAWFGLDLPGLIEQTGQHATIASATGLPAFGSIETREFWQANTETPISEIRWDGLRLLEYVKGSVACLTGRVRIDPDKDRAVCVRLMDETIRIVESAMRSLERAGAPRAVVVANGLLHHQRAIAEAAMRCGKEAFALEASCFPGLCHVEAGAAQTGARSALGREIRDRLQGAALTNAQRDRTASYLALRTPHTEQRIDSASQPEPVSVEEMRTALRIPDDHRVLLLLGQVCTDTTLVYDAPVIDTIAELARLAASVVKQHEGWTLVIKPHPKEETGADPIAGKPYTQGAYESLMADQVATSPHVRLLKPRAHNVYALMQLASAGLAINSQSALEMISMFAKPVALVGRAAFSGAGFTRDIAHRSAFESSLSALLNDPVLTTEEHSRALQYVDHAVFEHLIPSDARTPAEALRRNNRAMSLLLAANAAPSLVEMKSIQQSCATA